MARLQELILQLGLASVGEMNRAIFSYPDSGLLDALEQTFGVERVRGIRERVAESARVPILADEDVRVHDGVLNVSAIELTPLVTKFKALPLRTEESSGGSALVLAIADPLMEEAVQAFSQLFGKPVRVCLAREKAIMNAYALSSAQLSLSARREAIGHPDGNLPGVSKHMEDPEVRKAIQQITATAVKHSASNVQVDSSNPFTRAHFTFADGISSSVDISVSPTSVLASLFRRGQVLEVNDELLRAACRIRFKSVAVNFHVECRRLPGSDLPRFELSGQEIELKNFVIDDPDNPCFWDGMHTGQASAVRDMCDAPAGVYFLGGQRAPGREFAARAIVESYPDMAVVEYNAPLGMERSEFWSEAGDRRVLVVVPANDAFDILRLLAGVAAEKLALVRGMLVYQQLPRVCPFCAEGFVPGTNELLKIPAQISLPSKEFRKGKGCSICDEKGMLGFLGVTSVLDFDGYAGKVLRGGGQVTAIYDALAKDCFVPLLEDGLRAAGEGKAPFAHVVTELAKPPAEYLQAREASVGRDPTESPQPVPVRLELDDGADAHAERAFGKMPAPAAPLPPLSDQPIRGRDVFMTRSIPPKQEPTAAAPTSAEAVEKEDDHDWLFPSGPQEVTEQANGKKQKAQPTDGRPLLLVIDDDADQRAILRRVFEIAGYRVEVAADGIDGIISAVRLEPELIIVDFMMPELDGRETIRRLKAGPTTGEIPVVALTAYADPDVELGLLQAGADDFCPKSVSKQVLLKRVERLVKEGV